MIGAEKEKRDRKYRRALLDVLHVTARSSPTGTIIGRILADEANKILPPSFAVEYEAEQIGLCRDLASAKLVEMVEIKGRKKWQSFGLEWARFNITDLGTQLVEGRIAPHPLVADDRAEAED